MSYAIRYNRNESSNKMQKVNLGVTQNGCYGLFTNNVMAIPISKDEYDKAMIDVNYLRAICKRYGFEMELK